MGTEYLDEARTTALRDLALQLLDACRTDVAAAPQSAGKDATELEASTMSLALQAVFMADSLTMKSEGGIVPLSQERAAGMFYGLGVGVGNILGANGDDRSIEFAMGAYMGGFIATLPGRFGHARDLFGRSTFGKRPSPPDPKS